MKTKSLLVLLSAAGCMVAGAATTAVNNASTQNRGNGYWGFAVRLNSSVVTLSPSDPGNFEIESLTLSGRDTGVGTYPNMKIAVYNYTADATVGSFVGLSDVQTLSNNSTATFHFSGVTVDTSLTYQYLFVNSATTETDLDDEGLAGYQARSVSSSLAVLLGANLPSGSGLYKANTLNSWEGSYLPTFTFTAVPEPSTALLGGLGVLALLRRRR